jgi:hypothetical protein
MQIMNFDDPSEDRLVPSSIAVLEIVVLLFSPLLFV